MSKTATVIIQYHQLATRIARVPLSATEIATYGERMETTMYKALVW